MKSEATLFSNGTLSEPADSVFLKLKLTAPATAKTITYLQDRKWDPKALLYGKSGLPLTFCEVPIQPPAP